MAMAALFGQQEQTDSASGACTGGATAAVASPPPLDQTGTSHERVALATSRDTNLAASLPTTSIYPAATHTQSVTVASSADN